MRKLTEIGDDYKKQLFQKERLELEIKVLELSRPAPTRADAKQKAQMRRKLLTEFQGKWQNEHVLETVPRHVIPDSRNKGEIIGSKVIKHARDDAANKHDAINKAIDAKKTELNPIKLHLDEIGTEIARWKELMVTLENLQELLIAALEKPIDKVHLKNSLDKASDLYDEFKRKNGKSTSDLDLSKLLQPVTLIEKIHAKCCGASPNIKLPTIRSVKNNLSVTKEMLGYIHKLSDSDKGAFFNKGDDNRMHETRRIIDPKEAEDRVRAVQDRGVNDKAGSRAKGTVNKLRMKFEQQRDINALEKPLRDSPTNKGAK